MTHPTTIAVALRGSAHEKRGLPCQDVCAGNATATHAWLALADGAGSCPHAEAGAKAVVACAKTFLWRHRAHLETPEGRVALLKALHEALDRQAEKCSCTRKDLGSTFLAVHIWNGRYVAFHLGDGVIGCSHHDGSVSLLSAPENGYYANETWLTTSAEVLRHLRVYTGSLNDIDGFVMMSDGCAATLFRPNEKKLHEFVPHLFARLRELPQQSAKEELKAFLTEFAKPRTGDDISVAFLQGLTIPISRKNDESESAKLKLIRYLLNQAGRPCPRKSIVRHLHCSECADLQAQVFLPLLRTGAIKHCGGSLYTVGENAEAFLKGKDE